MFLLILVFLLAGMVSASPVHAHKVNLFANVEGNTIVVEGYFTDGKRAQNSKVTVYGPENELLVEGTTDDDGKFSFDIPQISDLRISLYAGMGHRTEYTLTQSELGSMSIGEDAGTASKPGLADETPTSSQVSAVTADPTGGEGVDSAAVQAMIRKAVGESLLPVMRNLSELKEQRTFSDIVGGIGFIVGIIGVFFYLKARRMSGKSSPTGV